MKLLITLFLFLASNAVAFDVGGSLPIGLGDGRYVQKSGDTMSGPLTLNGSSLTVTGNAFSVGTSTIVVTGGKVGVGVSSPLSKLTVAQQITEHPDTNKYGQVEATLTDPAYRMSMGYDATLNGGFLQAIINASSYRPIAINPRGGNVGIGDTAPSETLEVVGGIASYSRTMAQLLAITPSQVGVLYFCNTCTPAKMVVSTGTAAGNFAAIDGGTFQ